MSAYVLAEGSGDLCKFNGKLCDFFEKPKFFCYQNFAGLGQGLDTSCQVNRLSSISSRSINSFCATRTSPDAMPIRATIPSTSKCARNLTALSTPWSNWENRATIASPQVLMYIAPPSRSIGRARLLRILRASDLCWSVNFEKPFMSRNKIASVLRIFSFGLFF